MGENPPPQNSSLTLPCPPSEKEANFYYSGLPSDPVLVARTGTIPWKEPTGPEAYRNIKELRPVGNHALKEVWEDNLAPKLHALLDSMKVKWTSTDVVRIRDVKEPSGPVILWIGVIPASLSGNDGVVVASRCRELLVEYNISDVDVEIRQSVVTRSAGPKLLTSARFSDSTTDVREPLTATLGIPICSQSTPCVEGTGGFFIPEGGNTERLLLVTARHVVFTPDKTENKHFMHMNDSEHRHNTKIRGSAFDVEDHERRIKAVEGQDNPKANKERRHAQHQLDEAAEAIEELHILYQNVSTHWATPESRVLGHVILSPPISVYSSSDGYGEDWAVIEIDASKVDASNFNYNAIDLGTNIPIGEFTQMMRPNPKNPHLFTYPFRRLLRLEGNIPDDEMRHPTALDQNDDPCLLVIKRGNATNLTVGHANDIFSYARHYHDDLNKPEISKEWAILPLDSESGPFSAKGDSGSVVDGLGRIGGLLTSGAGTADSLDITYATPISFLLKRMQDNGLHELNIDPVLTAYPHSPDRTPDEV